MSVLGLLISAIATLWQVRVSDDQLQQSKEAAEQKARAQAYRVSLWVDQQRDGENRIHVTNRSPDPVSYVSMEFGYTSVWDPNKAQTVWNIDLPSLPPCSDTVIVQSQLWHRDRGTSADSPWQHVLDAKPRGAGWKPFRKDVTAGHLMFLDRNGEMWVHGLTLVDENDDHSLWWTGEPGAVVGQPRVDKAEPCDEPAQ
ncbi:hypothetical protein ACFC01_33135 [Streptomyces mirabilis]|uniref:hypothetical protein n=1 Tax=Streptomyces mirabilis TaxID=68239 RepID=UPI0035DDC120